MTPTLYQLAHSPYCIPITMALTSLGEKYKTINVSNADRSVIIQLTNGAYYQVPVLVHGKKVVYESGGDTIDVARYVDRHFGKGRLFPAPLEGIQTLLIQYIEDDIEGVGFRLADPHYVPSLKSLPERMMVIRHKERKFGRGCVEEWRKNAPALKQKLEELLTPLDQMLKYSPFLLGKTPVYSDFALAGVVGNYTYKGWNHIPSKLKALSSWYKRLQEFRY